MTWMMVHDMALPWFNPGIDVAFGYPVLPFDRPPISWDIHLLRCRYPELAHSHSQVTTGIVQNETQMNTSQQRRVVLNLAQ